VPRLKKVTPLSSERIVQTIANLGDLPPKIAAIAKDVIKKNPNS